jgi:hypothetical protein
MQQGLQAFPTVGIEGRLGPVRPRRVWLHGRHSPPVGDMNHVAHRLVVPGHGSCHRAGVLPLGAGRERVPAAGCEGLGRPEA